MDNVQVRRDHKDRLFHSLFGDERNKKNTLELYNAVNGSAYTDEDALTITTIEDAIYLGMKNDVSFLIGNTLNVYEHQSTYNPNMPVRGLMYFGKLYAKFLEERPALNVYKSKIVQLPTPKYIVFYNGLKAKEDRLELKLTDAFDRPEESCIELTAVMLNINHGRNRELMERTKTLSGYAALVDRIRNNGKAKEPEEAVRDAVDSCIEDDILKDYLISHRAEVIGMLTRELTEEEIAEIHFENGREEGREEGRKEGRKAGRKEGLQQGEDHLGRLIQALMADNRLDDVKAASSDAEVRRRLYQEYRMEEEEATD